ncbi:hypothetical protein MRB53_034635 [Persea americana]|uniref:Uncharacterized protein n=1 Tax=Persea americana TaxID=3435 RepID=A0ACC2K2C2_PERAE|nr:hypothetical protein MRB53_034635 [Persea americana]
METDVPVYICHETQMGMAASRWPQQGCPPYQNTSLKTEMGMAVVRGSRPGAAVGELGLQHPFGGLSMTQGSVQGKKTTVEPDRLFPLFFHRRRKENGKSPVEAEASRMTGDDGGDRLYLLKRKREEELGAVVN